MSEGDMPDLGLSVYAKTSDLNLVTSLADFSVTYVGEGPGHSRFMDRLVQTAEAHRKVTGIAPVLDLGLYQGTKRVFGDHPISGTWLRKQKAIGAPFALTDTGYIAANAPVGHVQAALDSGRRFRDQMGSPVVVALPVDSVWLSGREAELLGTVDAMDIPVSLMVGNANDPYSSKRRVKTLVELIGTGRVRVDRCDLSAIGALANGALGASIGTDAGRRHIYPPPKNPSKGRPRDASDYPSVLIPRLLCWRTLDHVKAVGMAYDLDDVWVCACPVCAGGRLDQVLGIPEVPRHNYAVINLLRERVMGSASPASTWRELVSVAQSHGLEIEAQHSVGWIPQDFLGAWFALAPVPA